MQFRSSKVSNRWLKSGLMILSLMSLLTASITLLSATSTQVQASSTASTSTKQQSIKRQISPKHLPNQIRKAVLQTHARLLGVPANQLRVISASQENWRDTCLGLGRPEEGCGLAMVSGWRVEVGQGAARWFYRTDRTGQAVRLEDRDNAGSLPQAVGQKVLEIASLDAGLSLNQLQIVAARPQLWNGCLGIAGPSEPCTMIGIPGWQVIVAGPQQYWVYHLDQQGKLIKRNPTTSGKGTVIPSFWQPDDNLVGTNTGDIIFQSVTRGGIAGESYKTLLRRDGQVVKFDLRSQPPKVPTLIRQLTPEQVQTFIQTLQQNEFGDFGGFNYVPTRGADYFTIALMTPGSRQGTQYVDIATEQTPAKLQQIIQAWNRITTPNRP